MIGLAFFGALIGGAILAAALVPSGDTLRDAENDANNQRGLFAVLCILAIIAMIAIV